MIDLRQERLRKSDHLNPVFHHHSDDDGINVMHLRKSVNDVKIRAAADAERRKSPMKAYSGVKSKVAGNMKSLRSAKKVSRLVEEQKALQNEVVSGNYQVLVQTKNRAPEASPERMRAIAEKQAELNNLAADFSKRRQEGTFVRGSDGTSQQQTFGKDQMGESLQFTVYDGPSDVSEGAAKATASFKSAAPG